MSQRHSLIAFLAVIAAIVGLALIAATHAAFDSQTITAVMTGLIGIAGSFRPKSAGDPPAV